jgi:hypothetical protein
VRGLYAFHKDKLVAANDQAGFQSAVDALDSGSAAMQGDSLYRRALPHVGDAAMTLFVRRDATRAFLERARRAAGDSTQTANAERMLEVADRYNIQSGLVAGWGWTDQGLSVRTYSMLDTSSPGAAPLRDMLKTPPSKIDVTGYFPDSTLGFYAVNFLDAPRIYDFAVAYLKDIAAAQDTSAGASAAAEVDSAIARFEKQAGMSVRNDVLGWMGRQAAFGLNDVVKGGFFPVPELTLAVQAADTAKARAFFTKLEVQITAAVQSSPQAFPVQFQEEDYKGVKIRFAPTPMGEGLAPAYAIHEGYALVALSGGTLKRMLDTKGGAVQPVRANPRFEAAGAFYPPQASSVGFVDLARLVGEIGAAISSFQQMRGGGAASPEQDTLRQVVAALQNLQAVAFYGTNDANGIEQRVLVKVQ